MKKEFWDLVKVVGNIFATGVIIDQRGNTNHHKH
jgi:hypothetical protein